MDARVDHLSGCSAQNIRCEDVFLHHAVNVEFKSLDLELNSILEITSDSKRVCDLEKRNVFLSKNVHL